MKKLFTLMVGVVIGIFFLMCLGVFSTAPRVREQVEARKSTDSRSPAKPAQPAKPDLELLTYAHQSAEFGSGAIVGTVRNNSARKHSYTQITFTLYDESGAQVGSAMANVNGLEAGGTWKFKAVCLTDGFTKFKLSELSGF